MVKTSFVGLLAVVLAVTSSLAAGQDATKPSSLTGTKNSQAKYIVGKVSPYTEASAKKKTTVATTTTLSKYTTAPAVDSADSSGAEDAYDFSTLADSADSSSPADPTESSGDKELVDASGDNEVLDSSAMVDTTDSSAPEDGGLDISTLFGDSTETSAAEEPVDSTVEDELVETLVLPDSADGSTSSELTDPSSEEEVINAAGGGGLADSSATADASDSSATKDDALDPSTLFGDSTEASATEESTDSTIEEELTDTSAPTDSTASSGEEELVDSSATADASDSSATKDDALDPSTLFGDSTEASATEESTDSTIEEELTDTSAPTDSTASSGEEELTEASAQADLTEASGEEELAKSASQEEPTEDLTASSTLVDSTAASGEAEPIEDLIDSSTEAAYTGSSSGEAEPVEELADSSSLTDLTSASGEVETTEELVDSSAPADYAEASGAEELTESSGEEGLSEELADASAVADSTAASGEEDLTESTATQEVVDSSAPSDSGDSSTTEDSTAPSPSVRPTPAPVSKASKPVTATPAPATKAPATAYKPPAVVPSLPNWIGSKQPTDKACYRKTHLTKKCPPGYEFDKIATCWAECPVEYPVECGMECIPQNKDCTLAVLDKINAVATVALNAATSGVFGKLATASKGVQRGVKCGQQLYAATNKIVGYAKELETKFPNTTKSQLQYLLTKSDFAVYDLPVAVTTCLGLPTPTGLNQVPEVVSVIKKLLEKVTINGQSILEPTSFIEVTSEVGAGESVSELKPVDLTELNKLLGSGVTCGTELKSIVDRVTIAVQEMKTTAPTSPVDAIRLAVSNSDLFLKDIPDITSSCVPKDAPNALQLREDIRKTFQVIVDQIFDASSNGDKPLSKAEYALKMADSGLDAVAMFDPTGIASMAKEFIQPICGPTSFIGEVDDGALEQALGFRTVGKAFAGSSGTWTKAGDGVLKITFESKDKKDVKVNIMSGGNKIAEVSVKKGKTVEWTKPLAEMKDKTMYLDRWRPGLLGLPGTGGGSLLLWVPHTSKGGHLELRAQLNVS